MKEENINMSPFQVLIKEVYGLISESHFQQCVEKISHSPPFPDDESVELKSILAYALTMLKQYPRAMQLLQQCLLLRPWHLPSKKRRAILLEKTGKIEQSKIEFQRCLHLQPESRSLRNKLKRLNMTSTSSEAHSSDSKESSNHEEKEDLSKSHSTVKFGSFEVIEFNTEDSDEHFAIIKEEISKLSEKKPKKSILKESMSASVFKDKEPKADKNIESEHKEQKDGDKLEKEFAGWVGFKNKKSKSVSFGSEPRIDDLP